MPFAKLSVFVSFCGHASSGPDVTGRPSARHCSSAGGTSITTFASGFWLAYALGFVVREDHADGTVRPERRSMLAMRPVRPPRTR
jgi:hypothetical protein